MVEQYIVVNILAQVLHFLNFHNTQHILQLIIYYYYYYFAYPSVMLLLQIFVQKYVNGIRIE